MGGVVGREEKCMHACMCHRESGIGLGGVGKLWYLLDIYVFA